MELIPLLMGVLRNQEALARIARIVLPHNAESIENLSASCTPQQKAVSAKLEMLMHDKQAFIVAIEKGHFVWEDNHLAWQMGTQTLLAYFLGRLFCGDKAESSKRLGYRIWKQGSQKLPSALIKEILGPNDLVRIRRQRKNSRVPENFQLIDSLFTEG